MTNDFNYISIRTRCVESLPHPLRRHRRCCPCTQRLPGQAHFINIGCSLHPASGPCLSCRKHHSPPPTAVHRAKALLWPSDERTPGWPARRSRRSILNAHNLTLVHAFKACSSRLDVVSECSKPQARPWTCSSSSIVGIAIRRQSPTNQPPNATPGIRYHAAHTTPGK